MYEAEEAQKLALSRRTELEQALKLLEKSKNDEEKETIINSFFDLEKATIRIETAEREIANQSAILAETRNNFEAKRNRYAILSLFKHGTIVFGTYEKKYLEII